MTSLSEIRARLSAAENRSNNSNNTGPRALYPHWNIPEGTTATVRFLPDANTKNPFFWVEQNNIRLPFAGIKGESTNPVTVTVPCVEMWGDACPILAEVRPWYKDDSLKEVANRYWKKRQYHFQGFVRESPLADDQTPENPIRRFSMTPQLFNVIKAALMDPELDELPIDYEHGLDFRITKTSKGNFADYTTSTWARRESALTDFERSALEQHGLNDLSSFLPRRPTEEELKVIHAMFEASVDGQAYDPERWGNYYRPFGLRGSDEEGVVSETRTPVNTPAPVTKVDEAPWEEKTPASAVPTPAEPASSPTKADDILAMIRARQQQN